MSYTRHLVDLFYPSTCISCHRTLPGNTKLLCPVCSSDIPWCEFSRFKDNRAELLFEGRIEIQAVASLFYFKKKGIVQKLMHALKYGGREDIGIYFGRILGKEMDESRRFRSVDLVIPVPLHPRKKSTRGYNQVSGFGRALAESLGAEYREGMLKRTRPGRSQTGKDRLSRNTILMNSFKLQKFNNMKYKHILIVDDIITSGSTLEACARLIQKFPGARVSLASLSFTL